MFPRTAQGCGRDRARMEHTQDARKGLLPASSCGVPSGFPPLQSRHTMPGWFGVGTGLLEFTKDCPERISMLQQMHRTWPFFRTFLSNCGVSSLAWKPLHDGRSQPLQWPVAQI